MMQGALQAGREKGRLIALAVGALTLGFGLTIGPGRCQAAGLVDLGNVPQISATLANVATLSDAAMARQTGGNLQQPSGVSNGSIGPPVRLWDELRLPSPQSSAANANISVTIVTPGAPGN